MAEEAGLKFWPLVQTITGALVVTSILGLAGVVGSMWRGHIEHGIFIRQFADFADDGKRYTKRDGNIDRTGSVAADAELNSRIDAMLKRQEQFRIECRTHANLSEHAGANLRIGHIEQEQEEMRRDLRNHIGVVHGKKGR